MRAFNNKLDSGAPQELETEFLAEAVKEAKKASKALLWKGTSCTAKLLPQSGGS